jgi:predicted Fe-Mo cluster-binding NifX family protein
MKIAVTISSLDENAGFDPRFGRAGAFVIFDTETDRQQVLANPATQASSGAGVQAAQMLVSHGVDAVVSGAFGPKAAAVLNAANIRLCEAPSGTVNDLINMCQEKRKDVADPTSNTPFPAEGQGTGPTDTVAWQRGSPTNGRSAHVAGKGRRRQGVGRRGQGLGRGAGRTHRTW